ncbi:hypothetical protein VNO78_18556 [Psophocarpus tetragonolobus]|uniref:Uncharacterized protein n=1 Tax=Psophocarpus tetragonolobus TaxID=3891 RepID=A0AAN9SK31_PSOTE
MELGQRLRDISGGMKQWKWSLIEHCEVKTKQLIVGKPGNANYGQRAKRRKLANDRKMHGIGQAGNVVKVTRELIMAQIDTLDILEHGEDVPNFGQSYKLRMWSC